MDLWNGWKIMLLASFAATVLAGDAVLMCEPDRLRGVPGEPLQVEVSVETERVTPVDLSMSPIDGLYLCVVETVPITRTKRGTFVQKHMLVWQGLEAGSFTLTNLTVQVGGDVYDLPKVDVSINAVEPALPPEQEAGE